MFQNHSQKIKFAVLAVFSIALLIFAGCKSSENISYGIGKCYQPDPGEKSVRLTMKVKDHFGEYCFTDTTMLLNRAIRGEQDAYISWLFYNTPQDFRNTMLQDDSIEILKESVFGVKDAVYYGFLTRKNDTWIYRVVFTEPGYDHLVIVDYLSDDETSINELFADQEKIKNKLNCGKPK